MKILKYLLLVIGPLGAILTLPTLEALSHPWGLVFLGICLGFCALTWFAWRMGRPKDVPVAPQSTQAAPLTTR
jgi:cbb3-type cytochrome oxidase subunit 3